MRVLAPIALTLFTSSAANAENYSVFSGLGGVTCGEVPERVQTYPAFEVALSEWTGGFLTGRNISWAFGQEREPLNLRAEGFLPEDYVGEIIRLCRIEPPETPIALVSEKVFAQVIARNGQQYEGFGK